MNTKGIKFLAVLAVLAMAFAAFAVMVDVQQDDAAKGDASSPLNDGAIATGASLTVGNMSLELYLQQTMSVVKSSNTLYIYGVDKITTKDSGAAVTDEWNGAYWQWNTASVQTISFDVTPLNGDATSTGTYYIYQSNSALPGAKKVSTINLAESDLNKTAADRKEKTNPSFEIPIDITKATDVKLKLITNWTGASAPTVAEAEALAEGPNCVEYIVKLSLEPANDSAAVSAGFTVSKTATIDDVKKTTYYKHLSAAIASITPSGSAKDAVHSSNVYAIKLLADDEDIEPVQTPRVFVSGQEFCYAEIDLDLGGHTYKNNMIGAGTAHDDKIINIRANQVWNIYNGSIVSDVKTTAAYSDKTKYDLDFKLIQSYGTLTLGKSGSVLTIDGSKVSPFKDNTTTTDFAVLFTPSGTTTINAGVTVDAGSHYAIMDAWNYAYTSAGKHMSVDTTSTIGSKVIVDGAKIIGNIGVMKQTISGAAAAGASIEVGASLTIKGAAEVSGTIKGGLYKNGGETEPTLTPSGALNYQITIDSMTVSDGKKVTIAPGTLVSVSAADTSVPGKIINNGNIDVQGTLQFLTTATSSAKTISEIGLQGTGNVFVTSKTGDGAYNGILVLNQGKSGSESNILASGENTIVVNGGAKLFVAQPEGTGTDYWYIVGDKAHGTTDATTAQWWTSNDPCADSMTADRVGFIFSPAAGGYVSIKANLSGGTLLSTDYVLKGDVKIGASCNNAWTPGFFFNNYLGRADTLTIDGTTTIGVHLEIIKGVKMFVLEGSKLVAGSLYTENPPATLTTPALMNVYGVVEYADSSQFYKNTEVKTGGEIKVAGEGGSSDKEIEILPDSEVTDKIDAKTFNDNPNAGVIVTTKSGLKEVTVPSGKEVVVEAVPASTAVVDVSANDSKATISTGDAPATYTVNAGGSNKLYLENVTGSLTFTKGSVEIDISQWTGGEIKLENGADVKIFGKTNADANLTISMKTAGDKATLMIEEEKEVEIEFTAASKVFTIGSGIEFTVDGKLTVKGDTDANKAYGNLTTNDKVNVKGTAKVTGTFHAVKALNVYGTLSVKTLLDADDVVVAYGTSDIEDIAAWDIGAGKLSGKDKNGGIWTFEGNTLTLTNYNGNYNFWKDAANIQTIVLSGENKVTYAKAFEGNTVLFGGAAAMTVKTVQGSGSLEIAVNMSKTKGTDLGSKTITVVSGTEVKLNGVELVINVTGSKADWTDKNIEDAKIIGINATNKFEMYDADLDMDIFSAYEAEGVYGLKAALVDGLVITPKPITITSCDEISIVSAGIAIFGAKAEILGTSVFADGNDFAMAITGLELTNGSTLVVPSGLIANDAISISQNAILTVTGFSYEPGEAKTLENNGSILLSGDAVIGANAKINNKAVLLNNGNMGIYGDFQNNGGVFTNSGNFTVFADDFTTGTDKDFTITGDSAPSADTYAKVAKITIDATPATKIVRNADGSASVEATVTFSPSITLKEDTRTFEGILTPSQTPGDASYTLYLSNGTAMITIQYDANKDPAGSRVGVSYTVIVSGYVETDDATYYLESNKTETTTTPGATIADDIDDLINADTTAPKFILSDGAIINDGEFVIAKNYNADSAKAAAIITGGSFTGNLLTKINAVTISGEFGGNLVATGTGKVTVGKFDGDIVSKGDVEVTAKKIMVGEIIAAKTVTIKGMLEGDILTNDSVTVSGTLMGDATIILKAGVNATLTVSGKMDGDLVYESLYKLKKDDTIDTEATSKMHVDADMTQATGTKSFEMKLAAGVNATASADGIPGYLTFGTTLESADVGKSVVLTLTEGELIVKSLVTIPERFSIVIEKDTTIEVSKSGGNLSVNSAALKVSKDATANFETGSAAPVNYGKVTYIMTFEVEGGAYTIYSDVAYALTNCDEGDTLTVGSSANIADNVEIKKGVNVVIADKVTLDFKTFGLEMAEDAKITIEGTGKLVFGQTGDNGKPAGKEWEFYTINGTIAFDDANVIVLNDVRFDATGAEFSGKEATASDVSKLNVKLNYSEGVVTVAKGAAAGTVALGNTSYKLSEDAASDTPFFATFVIAEGAVFDATSITDAFAVVDYEVNSAGKVVVKDVLLSPTVVAVEGTLNLLNNTEVKGGYSGLGTVTLAAGKEFKFAASDKVPAKTDVLTEKKVPGMAVVLKIVDTTDDQNGYILNTVEPEAGYTLAFQATSQKIGELTVNIMTVSGKLGRGSVIGEEAFIKELTINKDGSVVGDAVYVIGTAKSTATGYVGAQEIYMKETDKSFQELEYKVTFAKEDYTFYTQLATIDWDEITDITVAKDLTLEDDLDVSGRDVTIEIADDVTLTIPAGKKLIIGTPADSIGLMSVLSGNVKLALGAYVVAYADVDFEDAVFIDAEGTKKVKNSIFTIEDVLYATVFANSTAIAGGEVDFETVSDDLVPEIEGYIFTTWYLLNGKDLDKAYIGETSAYAGAKAVLLTVTVKFVEGVSYYCDGVEFTIFDTPTKVEYNSVFTAKINNTAKYQGTPVVNGKNSFIVTEDVALVATGVEPIPVPPEPEPEPVIGDSGISLTDILLIVLVVLIAIMVVILVLRLNRS